MTHMVRCKKVLIPVPHVCPRHTKALPPTVVCGQGRQRVAAPALRHRWWIHPTSRRAIPIAGRRRVKKCRRLRSAHGKRSGIRDFTTGCTGTSFACEQDNVRPDIIAAGGWLSADWCDAVFGCDLYGGLTTRAKKIGGRFRQRLNRHLGSIATSEIFAAGACFVALNLS